MKTQLAIGCILITIIIMKINPDDTKCTLVSKHNLLDCLRNLITKIRNKTDSGGYLSDFATSTSISPKSFATDYESDKRKSEQV